MNSTVSLDSFQIIIGVYLIYVSIKGSGTLYNFYEIKKVSPLFVTKTLRKIYAFCGILALTDGVLCIVQTSSGNSFLPPLTFNLISGLLTILIVLILAITIIWLRKKSKE